MLCWCGGCGCVCTSVVSAREMGWPRSILSFISITVQACAKDLYKSMLALGQNKNCNAFLFPRIAYIMEDVFSLVSSLKSGETSQKYSNESNYLLESWLGNTGLQEQK